MKEGNKMKNFIKRNKIKITIFIMILILALCCIPPIDYNSKNKLEIETPYAIMKHTIQKY